MSSDKIYLSREEQLYLMEMLELESPIDAVEKFALLMVEEKADPTLLRDYIKKIMKNKLEKK